MFTLIGDENERKIRFRVRFLSVKITLKIGTFVRPGFSAGDLCDAVHGTVTYDGPEDDNWDQQVPSNECCADVRVNVSAPVNTELQRQRHWQIHARDTPHPLPPLSVQFHFMQFSVKTGFCPKLTVGAPLWEILDPPLNTATTLALQVNLGLQPILE